MLGWLYQILIGRFKECEHKWEIYRETTLLAHRDDGGHKYGTMYLQKCSVCGELKTFVTTNR